MLSVSAGYNKGVAIAPSDKVDFVAQGTFGNLTSGIYVGVTGNVVVVWQDGSTSTFKGVPAGTVLSVQARRVNATNTTATDLVALYKV